MGLKIRLDKNLDGLVAGVDFDADWCIAETHFVSATILSPNDRMRQLRPAPCDSAVCGSRHDRRTEVGVIVRLNEQHSPHGDVHRHRVVDAFPEPGARIPP